MTEEGRAILWPKRNEYNIQEEHVGANSKAYNNFLSQTLEISMQSIILIN